RQPDEPGVAVMSLPSPKPGGAAARFAFRGIARSDRDLAASMVFTKVLEARLKSRAAPAEEVFVHNEYRTLPGLIVMGIPPKVDVGGTAFMTPEARQFVIDSIAGPINEAEFQAARSSAAAEWARRDPVSFWLDADTYRI